MAGGRIWCLGEAWRGVESSHVHTCIRIQYQPCQALLCSVLRLVLGLCKGHRETRDRTIDTDKCRRRDESNTSSPGVSGPAEPGPPGWFDPLVLRNSRNSPEREARTDVIRHREMLTRVSVPKGERRRQRRRRRRLERFSRAGTPSSLPPLSIFLLHRLPLFNN